jgi:hypothetical protein
MDVKINNYSDKYIDTFIITANIYVLEAMNVLPLVNRFKKRRINKVNRTNSKYCSDLRV